MISGKTTLIAHIGYPIETFKAPLISAIALYDVATPSAEGLAARLRKHYPKLDVEIRNNDARQATISWSTQHRSE